MTLCDIRGLCKSFGGLKAVKDFSMTIERGGLHGLIGPNGAGKTTVFNLLTGVYRPDAGVFLLDGQTVTGMKPNRIAREGVTRTFQNIRLFGELSVLVNVKVAHHLRARTGMAATVLRTTRHRAEEEDMTREARRMLSIFGLAGREDDQAKNLPYGDQRRLEIARALATEPKLLLLDEPAAGMNPQEKRHLRELIQKIRAEFGLTVLLIEHDMDVVFDVVSDISVLHFGAVVESGSCGQIQKSERVQQIYLGTG